MADDPNPVATRSGDPPPRRRSGRALYLSFHVRLTDEMYDALCRLAAQEETTCTALVRRAIRRTLWPHPSGPVQSQPSPPSPSA